LAVFGGDFFAAFLPAFLVAFGPMPTQLSNLYDFFDPAFLLRHSLLLEGASARYLLRAVRTDPAWQVKIINS
jgi:hypothetical protein